MNNPSRLPSIRMPRARFEIVKVAPDCVWIADLSIDMSVVVVSVTNDAEAVCRRLYWRYGDRRYLYQDTMGNWDELTHEQGRFVEFKSARGQQPGKWAND